jgi:hypothetical protein
MPRRTRPILLVPLAAAALAVAGCSTAVAGAAHPLGAGPAPAPAAAQATDDPVAWADQVCGTLLPALRASANSPQVDYTDPGKAGDTLDQHLREVSEAAGTGLAALDRIGPAPTPHGDELVAQFRASLVALQQLDPDARKDSGARPTTPPAQANPFKLFSEDPELASAAAAAGNCTALYTAPAPAR